METCSVQCRADNNYNYRNSITEKIQKPVAIEQIAAGSKTK